MNIIGITTIMGIIKWLSKLKPLRVSTKLRGLYFERSIGIIISIFAMLLNESPKRARRIVKVRLYSRV